MRILGALGEGGAQLFASAKSDAVGKMSAIETAEGMAAAAIADMTEMREQLEQERCAGRRCTSERAKRSYAVKQDLLHASAPPPRLHEAATRRSF